jgi:hypothetical protein
MEYKVTDIVEVHLPEESGIEINIGIENKGLYTDVGTIRLKVKNEHYDRLSGLASVIKSHLKKLK